MTIQLDVFVASKIGSFKHVKYDSSLKKKPKDSSRHLQDIKLLQKGEGICSLTWYNEGQTEIILSRQNRILQTFGIRADEFTSSIDVNFGSGKPHSICVSGDTVACGVESGVVKVWMKDNYDSGKEINVGRDLEKIRMPVDGCKLFASGGKENELKIWDIETAKTVFEAKNLAHDFLQLRVPVWVSDMCFMENCEGKMIAACSRYGSVRLYDTRTQRRPVVNLQLERQPFNCISLGHREKHVLVGSGRGVLNLVDLRMKGRFDKGYKGSAGSITDVFCCKDRNVVVSTSLDRYLRIHDAETKRLIGSEYLTSKLSCFLLRTHSEPLFERLIDQSIVKEELEDEIKEEEEVPVEEDDEYEDMFKNMEVISDGNDVKRKKKKSKSKLDVTVDDEIITEKTPKLKKKKKSTVVPEEVPENNDEEIQLKPKKKKREEESKTPSKKKKKQVEESATPAKKKRLDENVTPAKKIKKKLEEDEEQPVSLDESIKNLLKSSEKIKKKYEKQRKEKKAKSVFN